MGKLMLNGRCYTASSDNYSLNVLWDYVTDNSGSVLFGTYTKTLHSNINNYDSIILELMSSSGDSGYWNATVFFTYNVKTINESKNPNHVSLNSYDTRSSAFYIKDTTIQKIIDNQSNINGLVRVYGLNMGGSDCSWNDLIGVLTAGQTSIQFVDSIITTDSTIDVYTDADVDYNSITVAAGSVTLTFDAQANDMKVKVRVS